MSHISLFACLAIFISHTLAIDKTVNPELNAKLKLVATNLDRHNVLAKDGGWEFPGSVVNANAATFPALTGVGMMLAMLNLGPCAMFPPHLHPRATNLVVAVSGDTTSYMVGENGAKVITTKLTPGVMTIFPQGSLHMMANNGCGNAQLVSALNHEDTGTTNLFNSAFGNLPSEYLQATFGDYGFDIEHMGKNIPEVGTGSVPGSAECMKRCGLNGQKSGKIKRLVV
ncbi:spherulin-1A [Zopfia rhizophila CBS 207.26]|uniref:Spherulin-1A n=1 Tax=Zopfia rhizophila CBS 207.26 TaxID=1314779 RepID=A0A6A6EST2_9PEZI|nr:spherulin-1A [Zopfia rhizophila CBS 207.26]